MSLYQRGGIWWVYLVHQGRRIRRSTGYREKPKAQRLHDELRAKLWQRRLHSGHTWADATKEWLKARSRGDEDKYRLKVLKMPEGALAELTAETIQSAIAARPTNPGTYNRYADLVRAILRLALAKGWIEAEPKFARMKKPKGRIRFLSPDEWARLKKALPAHLKGLAIFSLATGLRQKNATHLEWSQVDLARRVCWIHPDQAKAGEAIGVPLSDEAVRVLRAQRRKHETWVFPYDGHPLAKINRAWRTAMKKAQIHNFTWHGLRHTWASWHVMRGTPLSVLRELGGWKTLEMVQRYAHLAPDHLAAFAGAVDRDLRHRVRTQQAQKAA